MGAIYIVPKPKSYNPGVSLPLITSGHGFCGYPWLSRSEGGPFYFSAREELKLMSWPENQGILFFYISKTLEMIRISFMASLLNAVL